MINILIPLAGKNTFKIDDANHFPKILTDVDGKLIIERAVKSLTGLNYNKIVVAIPKKESETFRLNNIIPLLGKNFEICTINGDTQGAVCSALLAIEHLDPEMPLVISSFEQILDLDLTPFITDFEKNDVDAGVLTFESIHPKWSYVKVNENQLVTQAAEKNPISKNAIAGLYYYKNAELFVEAAKSMIRKDVKTNNLFFISSTLNEIILKKGKVKSLPIDKNKYFHINDDYSFHNFEDKIFKENEYNSRIIKQNTEKYIQFFNAKEITPIRTMLSDSFSLIDPSVSLTGKDSACTYIEEIFKNIDTLEFRANNIFISTDNVSTIEFTLRLDKKTYSGVDILSWNNENQIVSLKAYLYEN